MHTSKFQIGDLVFVNKRYSEKYQGIAIVANVVIDMTETRRLTREPERTWWVWYTILTRGEYVSLVEQTWLEKIS